MVIFQPAMFDDTRGYSIWDHLGVPKSARLTQTLLSWHRSQHPLWEPVPATAGRTCCRRWPDCTGCPHFSIEAQLSDSSDSRERIVIRVKSVECPAATWSSSTHFATLLPGGRSHLSGITVVLIMTVLFQPTWSFQHLWCRKPTMHLQLGYAMPFFTSLTSETTSW